MVKSAGNFNNYKAVRFKDAPQIDVEILSSPDAPVGGPESRERHPLHLPWPMHWRFSINVPGLCQSNPEHDCTRQRPPYCKFDEHKSFLSTTRINGILNYLIGKRLVGFPLSNAL